MNSSRNIKIALCLLAVLLATKNLFSLRGLNRLREEHRITHLEKPLENAPPMLAFSTLALGGFRGLIANYLWIRANALHNEGRYFETLTLAGWITQLQPRISDVWEYQAWNMAYNISREFDDPEERWMWIDSGIRLLRDEALRYNPQEPDLYRELAWFYEDKFGQTLDEEHRFYKVKLATDMVKLFGRKPDYTALLDPQTDEARATVERMKKEFNLDPAWMAEVDREYGPFDWRLPEAHAVYWASLGLKRARVDEDVIILRRTIWQSMHAAFKHGRLIENQFTRTLDFGPNMDLLVKTHETFVSLKAAEAEEGDQEMVDYVGRAHLSFLSDAVFFLFGYNRIGDANFWFQRMKELYPHASPKGETVNDFAVRRVTDMVKDGNRDRVVAIIEGYLNTAYYNMVIGEEEDGTKSMLMAMTVHKAYHGRIYGQSRLQLPDIEKMKATVANTILNGENPAFTLDMRAVFAAMAGRELKLTQEELDRLKAREEAEKNR